MSSHRISVPSVCWEAWTKAVLYLSQPTLPHAHCLLLLCSFGGAIPEQVPRALTPQFIAVLPRCGGIWPPYCNCKGRPGEKQGGSGQILELLFHISMFTNFFLTFFSICTPESRTLVGVCVGFEEINTRVHPRLLFWRLFEQRRSTSQC